MKQSLSPAYSFLMVNKVRREAANWQGCLEAVLQLTARTVFSSVVTGNHLFQQEAAAWSSGGQKLARFTPIYAAWSLSLSP